MKNSLLNQGGLNPHTGERVSGRVPKVGSFLKSRLLAGGVLLLLGLSMLARNGGANEGGVVGAPGQPTKKF